MTAHFWAFGHCQSNDDADADADDTYDGDDDDIHLHREGVNEVASLAEVQAVQADEPVGGWDQFCQKRHLGLMIVKQYFRNDQKMSF